MGNRRCLCGALSTLVLAGSAGLAQAQALLRFEVSRPMQEDWHSSIDVMPGASVDLRLVVTYTGTGNPIGFYAVNLQPTISQWSAETGDTLLPLVNGGVGGNNTTPVGGVPDAPGQYGRIVPFAGSNYPSSNFLRGHVNTVESVEYLRIAASRVTSWFGATGNNTSAAFGVLLRQLNTVGRTAADPPFDGRTSFTAFKCGLTFGGGSPDRTLTVDAPAEGIWALNSFSNLHLVEWWGDMGEFPPSFSGPPTVAPATIHVVPTPGGLGLIVALAGTWCRRARMSPRLSLSPPSRE